jgi:hypothetical protein
MDRPKFLRHYANGEQLRVEQIGPHLWSGAVYRGVIAAELLDTPEPKHIWDVFTALTVEAAKHGSEVTVEGLQQDGPWVDLSDMRDEDWETALAERRFPGYPPREGMERWSGF